MIDQSSSGYGRRLSRILLLLGTVLTAGSVGAVEYDLSDAPLFVVEGADPNVVLTMDDSGSMQRAYMPESLEDYVDRYGGDYVVRPQALSSRVNRVYYNPNVEYTPPVDQNGNSLANASFTSAWVDGYDKDRCQGWRHSGNNQVDLSSDYRPSWERGQDMCDDRDRSVYNAPEYAGDPQPAFFYRYNESLSGCSDRTGDDDCYEKVLVDESTAPAGVDGKTNFANWYSYYRFRSYVAKAAVSRSFVNLTGDVRVGYQSINDNSFAGVDAFEGGARGDFYDWLLDLEIDGSTPLKEALREAGDYFSTEEPYREDPGRSSSETLSCRQNFHIMMTDGYWNEDTGVGGNRDNSNQSLPDNEYGIGSYSPMAPYKDGYSDTLADNAFYYWYRDLRPGMDNDVPTSINDTSTPIVGSGAVGDADVFWNPANDPANWQHMVNLTIGFGVEGELDHPGDYEDLLSGDRSWPGGDAGNDGAPAWKIDDLWHAAINSRGRYLSARNSEDLVEAFDDAINQVTQMTGSYAPAALNSGTISSDSRIFFSRFETNSWVGHVLARPVSDGSNCGAVEAGEVCPVVWDAACGLNQGTCAATGSTGDYLAPGDRTIITRNPDSGEGIAFRWSALSDDQQESLRDPDGSGPAGPRDEEFGQDRLDFLRGDRSDELSRGGEFRNRQSVLGDTISSTPVYVGAPDRYYPGSDHEMTELDTYDSFADSRSGREPVVYVGANDGMLHGFRASDGREVLAYIPEEVFPHLGELSRPTYTHRNYVDGPLNQNDVHYNSAWHTVLVGGLGLGGQGYFGLDVTNPGGFSESGASGVALWEFTDEDDADLGYTYGEPAIVRLANGRWVAIFGNGINATEQDGHASDTGNAVVYIVDIQSGDLIKKLDTKAGIGDAPGDLADRPNGIMGVFPADLEGDDFIVDRLYATDLYGNVWAFDLSGSGPGSWGPAYGSTGNPTPLYTATGEDGRQPITSEPVVIRHPSARGAIVLFGTGRYLGREDITDTSTQTFYGIWDRMSEPVGEGRSHLQRQSITDASAPGSLEARVVTDNEIRWDDGQNPRESDEKLGWFIDLPESGERVFQRPTVRNGRLIFRTVTPSDDPCEAGGSSWLMEVDATDGSRLDFHVFDYNQDRNFDADDAISDIPGSGIRDPNEDVASEPNIMLNDDGRTEMKYYTSSSGQLHKLDENTNLNRRTPWRQVR